MDPARGKLDQHEHGESRQAAWSPDLDREEVGRGEGVPVSAEKLPPRPAFRALGGRFQAVFFEHVRDGAAGHVVSEIVDGTADARVSPGAVLDGHPYEESSDFLHERRVTRATAVAAVVLPRDQLSMPTQEGVRRDERSEVAERPATHGLGFRCQAGDAAHR